MVSKDIPNYVIAYSTPIKVVRYLFNEQQTRQLELIKWWDFDEEKSKKLRNIFSDIDDYQ